MFYPSMSVSQAYSYLIIEKTPPLGFCKAVLIVIIFDIINNNNNNVYISLEFVLVG